MAVDWSEIHPDVAVVEEELRRLRYEKLLAQHRERQQFVDELKQTLNATRRFRDTRPKPKRKYIRRQYSVAEFTQRQLTLGEKILNDIAIREGSQQAD